MFESSHPVPFFDYFRIPYRVAADTEAMVHGLPPSHPLAAPAGVWLAGSNTGPRLYWLPADHKASGRSSVVAAPYRIGTTPIFGAVAPDAVLEQPLRGLGWEPVRAIARASSGASGSVWRHPNGSMLLPFDPGEVIHNFWSERYARLDSNPAVAAASAFARRAYYRVRPALPRSVQIRLRQSFSRVQERATFPRWPVEPALSEFYDLLFGFIAAIAGQPIPYMGAWPRGREWALVLTHDVETAYGYEHLGLLRDIELSMGLRSSWNFVPRRYHTHDHAVRDLREAGFEVGVHGLYHDGRDLGSHRTFRRRIRHMHNYARQWGAVGFRSPALHRRWEWMPELQFEYDSSYPDTDPYNPVPGGCCSILPYHNRSLVELPITLAQDFVLFDLLQNTDEALWVDKAAYIRRSGGMALLVTHPDYMVESARQAAYARFLAAFKDDPTVWHALPSQVARWWHRRQASHLEPAGGSWRVVGPAAEEAAVSFTAQPPIPAEDEVPHG